VSKPVNCIFAVHFDDDQDPRYKEIIKLMMSMDMWRGENLVTTLHCKSVDEMKEILGD